MTTVIVEGIVACTGAHLLYAGCSTVCHRPIALDSFAICFAGTRFEVQGVQRLALCFVRWEMELGNGELHCLWAVGRMDAQRDTGEPRVKKVSLPLTDNVIGKEDP